MKAPARKRSPVLANLVLTFVGQAIALSSQLLLVPVYLSAWGEEVYGDWLTLSAVSSYLTLSDMGMQMYVVNKLTGHAVRGEEGELKTTLHSSVLLYIVTSFLALAAILVLALLLPWQRWFASRAMAGPQAQLVVIVLGVSVIASVWGGFLAAMYRVFGEPQRSSLTGVVQKSLALAATIIPLGMGASPVAMAEIQLALALNFLVWAGWDVRRRHPSAALSLKLANVRVAVGMLAPSGLFTLLGVASSLTVQGTLLVASTALGPAMVTVFSTSRTLANAVKQVVLMVGYVAWPELTRLDAGGSQSTLASAHRLLVKASALCTAWIGASLWFTGPTLHHAWTRGRSQFDPELFRLLLAHALLLTPAWASSVLMTATNRHRALSLLYVAQGAITVGLCWILIRVSGLKGMGQAILLTDVPLFALLIPLWSSQICQEKLRLFLVEIYLKLTAIVVSALAIAWLVHLALPTGLWSIVASVAATAIPVGIGGVLWLRPDERQLIARALVRRQVAAQPG